MNKGGLQYLILRSVKEFNEEGIYYLRDIKDILNIRRVDFDRDLELVKEFFSGWRKNRNIDSKEKLINFLKSESMDIYNLYIVKNASLNSRVDKVFVYDEGDWFLSVWVE